MNDFIYKIMIPLYEKTGAILVSQAPLILPSVGTSQIPIYSIQRNHINTMSKS